MTLTTVDHKTAKCLTFASLLLRHYAKVLLLWHSMGETLSKAKMDQVLK